MNHPPIVILTALGVEYEAVRARLTSLRPHRHDKGTRYEVGQLREDPRCRVALALVGKGNHPAAVLAERAMAEFAPPAAIFVGVAGALWPDIPLGDVVVASQVYAYHGATSEDDGPKARPRVWEIPHAAAQTVHQLVRDGGWRKGLAAEATPQVRFGPIAAGEVVQDSAVSAHAAWVRRHYHDALAIEMEAAGVAQAAHLHAGLPVVVVRGISDRADGTKTTTDAQHWQSCAAAHAAAFASALASALAADAAAAAVAHDATAQERSIDMHARDVTNLATGNARVGVQAGHIHGNVTVGASAGGGSHPDLAAEIAALRQLIKQAAADGRLDQDTYLAAEAELDTLDECIELDEPHRRGTLTVTLKRLRGLVADVAEIAAKVAVIVTALRGLT